MLCHTITHYVVLLIKLVHFSWFFRATSLGSMQPHKFFASAQCFRLDGRIWRCLAILVYLIGHVDAYDLSKPPVIFTKWGSLRGKWSLSVSGNRPIANFLGIPYAQPPVGELRFKSPQRWNNTWTEMRDATTDGQKCIQIDIKGTRIVGSEDCLYLNIFTPDTSAKSRWVFTHLPVLVFVHPGGFNIGSSNSKQYAPDYLLQLHVIVVTLSYRLNALGFFSTVNEASPGNYGIKDVKLALEWIQENIHSFNGDRSAVTLMGMNAGAAITHFLALSKKTEGLFYKYILHSGSALTPWSLHPPRKYRQVCLKLAKLVGCLPKKDDDMNDTTNKRSEENNGKRCSADVFYSKCTIKDDEEIMSCMRRIDAEKIVKMTQSFDNPFAVFGPTLEPDSEDAILAMHPLKIIKEGLFRDIPVIMQVVKDEVLFQTAEFRKNPIVTTELSENFKEYFHYLAECENVISNAKVFTSAVQDFYCEKNGTSLMTCNVTAMLSDSLRIWPVFQSLHYQSKKANSSMYFSVFAYESTFSSTYAMGIPFSSGVSLSDDLISIFPRLKYSMFVSKNVSLHLTGTDVTMIDAILEMWTYFMRKEVKYYNALSSIWPDYRNHHKFMIFGKKKWPDYYVERFFLPDRMTFWENLSNVSIPLDVFIVPSKDTLASNANTIDCKIIITLIILSIIIFL